MVRGTYSCKFLMDMYVSWEYKVSATIVLGTGMATRCTVENEQGVRVLIISKDICEG